MGIETIKLKDLEGKAKNIYEAIEVMAKRARHLNNKRLADKEEIMDGTDESEEFTPEIIVPTNRKRETKVATIALDEFLAGEIEFKYVEPMPMEGEELPESTDEETSDDTKE
ncbi:MAG: DNA-directed RNA polymerase subunit omega [Candidatus Marinimicrobia bacterium]|nr:DNA-directed RNA polymerase subunit omega [Candidatus Neomarinimicrobiota bacterium]